MDQAIISAIDELSIYFFPGMLVGIALLYATNRSIFQNNNGKHETFTYILLFATFYFLGIIIFRISHVVIYPLKIYYQVNPLESIINHYAEYDAVSKYIVTKYSLSDLSTLNV
ncbi:hypothetical protein [Desulfosediminicola sp.]|uniref:hypothetical protein n=1 Tax=Desulfosediminicola sp. TaxID=2886825 RepID=UPI003AF1E7E7